MLQINLLIMSSQMLFVVQVSLGNLDFPRKRHISSKNVYLIKSGVLQMWHMPYKQATLASDVLAYS